jgi:formylglycine-generating enzyme required for sulfatase activity
MVARSRFGLPDLPRNAFALCFFVLTLIAGFTAGTSPKDEPAKDERSPVPEPASQEKAEKLIKELFQDEYAKKASADKLALAAKLLDQAKDTKDDPVARFVLMREARDLAAEAGDAPRALKAVESIGKEYAINTLQMKLAALETVEKMAGSRARSKSLVDVIMAVVDEGVATDDFEVAVKLLKLGENAARKSKNIALVTSILSRNKQVESLKKEYEQIWPAANTLTKNPNDPEANLAVGKYLCFTKGDWDKGMPMLALGADVKLKNIAEKDLASPQKPIEQAALGDEWWDIAEAQKGEGKMLAKSRAYHWYKLAVPGLTGLTKTRIEKRISQLQPLLPQARRGDHKQEKFIANSVGLKLAYIPPGKFIIENPRPRREVEIPRSFYMGIYEVTQKQYAAVMNSNPSQFKPQRDADLDLPVERVTWEEANDFCAKLSALREEREAGRSYRLPTEAEWEYAYRAGGKESHYFDPRAADEYAWSNSNSGGKTHPVGQLKPNAWGLYDMIGNVWEWCSDSFDGKDRVLRGSSLFNNVDLVRTHSDPARRTFDFGFRIVGVIVSGSTRLDIDAAPSWSDREDHEMPIRDGMRTVDSIFRKVQFNFIASEFLEGARQRAKAHETRFIFHDCKTGYSPENGNHEIDTWQLSLMFGEYTAGLLALKATEGHCQTKEHLPCAKMARRHMEMLVAFKNDLQNLVNEIEELEAEVKRVTKDLQEPSQSVAWNLGLREKPPDNDGK